MGWDGVVHISWHPQEVANTSSAVSACQALNRKVQSQCLHLVQRPYFERQSRLFYSSQSMSSERDLLHPSTQLLFEAQQYLVKLCFLLPGCEDHARTIAV